MLAKVDGFEKFKIMVVRLDLAMEKRKKNNINFCLFSIILKNSHTGPKNYAMLAHRAKNFLLWQNFAKGESSL